MTAQEVYTHGYGEPTRQWLSQRRAAQAADFFLPHLRAGMRVLDCGCGPGSITVDLAAMVAPGAVVGIDIEATQFADARAIAAERRVDNVEFQVASIYDLPFPDASFDAVFAHTTVEHISRPQAAFEEVRRVLRSGGVFGIRDPDYGTWRMEPSTPGLRSFAAIVQRVQELNGASPNYAPHQRDLLLRAGFTRSEAGASAMGAGSPEALEASRIFLEEQFRQPVMIDAAAQCGYDATALQGILEEVTAWSLRPDAFWALMLCHAIAWAP